MSGSRERESKEGVRVQKENAEECELRKRVEKECE